MSRGVVTPRGSWCATLATFLMVTVASINQHPYLPSSNSVLNAHTPPQLAHKLSTRRKYRTPASHIHPACYSMPSSSTSKKPNKQPQTSTHVDHITKTYYGIWNHGDEDEGVVLPNGGNGGKGKGKGRAVEVDSMNRVASDDSSIGQSYVALLLLHSFILVIDDANSHTLTDISSHCPPKSYHQSFLSSHLVNSCLSVSSPPSSIPSYRTI